MSHAEFTLQVLEVFSGMAASGGQEVCAQALPRAPLGAQAERISDTNV